MTDRFHARLAELDREPLRPAHGYTFRYLATHPGATTVDLAAHLLTLTERGHDYVRLADRLRTEVEQELADVTGPDRLAAVDQDLRAYIDLVYGVYGDRPIHFRPVW
ncbi:hypothetical protein ACMATS_33360 [Streptoverticillium reticulum]|uniref:hypothetical protein n=1 Tax=Streptoverticillium reticulum TaxID=1433415 RepID=UPI0039BFCEAB